MNGLTLGAFYTALYLYDGAGNMLWKIDLTDGPLYTGDWFFSPHAGVVDATGHILVVGYYRKYNILNSEIPTFRRYNRHGVLKQSFEIQVSGVSAASLQLSPVVAIDSSDNIYVMLSKTTSSYQGILQKYSSAGSLQWQVILVSSVFQATGGTLAIDNAGDLVVSYFSSFSGYLSKRDASDGSEIWTVAHAVGANWLAIDSSDNIYASLGNGPIEKYNSSGTLQAANNALIDGKNNRGRVFLYDSHVYVSGRYGCNQFSDALVTEATYTTKPEAVDSQGNFYFIAGNSTGSLGEPLVWAREGSPDGAILWEGDEPLSGIGFFNWELFVTFVETVEPEPLRLPLALKIPTTLGDLYNNAPGLPLSLGLSAPRWLLEPSSYGSEQTLFRAYLSGSPLLYLKISSFSCQRNPSRDTFSIVCPALSSDDLAVIEDRLGNTLAIQSGFRIGLNPVQYMDFVVGTLDGVRSDTGATSASVSLSGYTETVTPNPQTRRLRGVSYFGPGQVRAALDPYLQPGDTADLGSETFTVTSISYAVSATSATMTVGRD